MTQDRIIIVSPNAGTAMGGEAIKAYQFFLELQKQWDDVILVTHGRCRQQLSHLDPDMKIIFIDDDAWTRFFWRSRIFRALVDIQFHYLVHRLIKSQKQSIDNIVVHYLTPISPVAFRLPVKGVKSILGPINGSISYPPGFAARQAKSKQIIDSLHMPIQYALRFLLNEKNKFDTILVSGGERTRRSLAWAGASDQKIVDVVDSGVNIEYGAAAPIHHKELNTRFICSGRFVDYKGIDLAIKAVARSARNVTLDIYGAGEKENDWRALVEDLDLSSNVHFLGWCTHDELMKRMLQYRGYLFPTLAEANGIVMQEAMMIGLPVVCLNWGGPQLLADSSSAILIEPDGEDYVVSELGKAMERLAADPDAANSIATNARAIAEERFLWPSVVETWTKPYQKV